MAELVDALDSKSSGSDIVWVRVPPPAPCLIDTSKKARFYIVFIRHFYEMFAFLVDFQEISDIMLMRYLICSSDASQSGLNFEAPI